MAYSSILDTAISVGSAIKRELMLKIKNNFDDHESRISAVEVSSSRKVIWEFPVISAAAYGTATGVLYFEATQDFTITNASIRVFEVSGITGTLQVDVKKSTTNLDGASFTTIFTTKPSVNYSTASNYEKSSNQVFDSGAIDIVAGNYLRLDITSTPSSGGVAIIPKFLLSVYGE